MSPDQRGIRFFLFLLAFACVATAGVVAVRGSSRPVVGNQSFASAATALAALVIGAYAGSLAFDRSGRIVQVQHWIEEKRRLPHPSMPAPIFALTVMIAGVIHAGLLVDAALRNSAAVDDQADYLQIAQIIKSSIGSTGLPGALWRGEFAEANRHPLYLALIAIHPTFSFGRGLSVAFALATFGGCVAAATMAGGRRAAALAAVFLAVNGATISSGSLVACESLLAFLGAIAWCLLTMSCHRSVSGAASVGAVVGLAYLTKGSGLFLLPPLLAAIAFDNRTAVAGRLKFVAVIVAAFIVVSLPLLVRNYKAYGNPLHSFNSKLLFFDSFEEGKPAEDLGTRGNWERYKRTHSWSDVGQRCARGLAWESFIALRSLGPVPLDSGRAAFGLAVAITAILGWATSTGDQQSLGGLLLGWWFVFGLFFAWYLPIAASDRFVMPLVGPTICLAACGAARCLTRGT